MNKKKELLIWVDLEMTGLDLRVDTIMQIAIKVTDTDLNPIPHSPLGSGVEYCIHVPKQDLEAMGEWCQNQHGKSGLTKRCLESTLDMNAVEQAIMRQLITVCVPGMSPMCGNSIHVDRVFMQKYMPRLEKFFHYRNLDVSTLKQLHAYWSGREPFEKARKHTALDDIDESIAELAFYRETFIANPFGAVAHR